MGSHRACLYFVERECDTKTISTHHPSPRARHGLTAGYAVVTGITAVVAATISWEDASVDAVKRSAAGVDCRRGGSEGSTSIQASETQPLIDGSEEASAGGGG